MSRLKIRDQSDPNTWYEVPAGGVGVPSGGTQGQALLKTGPNDHQTGWGNVVTSVNGQTGAVTTRELSNAAPAETLTVAQCLAYAQSNPFKIFVWARYAAATYTPDGVAGNWIYTLYTTYSESTNYVVFEAQSCNNGKVYRAKLDGTWVKVSQDVSSVNGQTGAVTVQPTIKTGSVTLAANWTGSGPYTQTVTVSGATVTSNSKVDIQPDATAIMQLVSDGVYGLYIENNSGTLTAYAIGAAPTVAMTLQAVVTEVL